MVAQILNAKDFTDPQVGAAFEQIIALHNAGVSVFDETVAKRELKAGGCQIVDKLYATLMRIPNINSYRWHADRLKNFSRLRSIHDSIAGLSSELYAPRASADEVLGWLDSQLMRLRHGAVGTAREFRVIADEVIAEMQARVGKPDPAVMLSGLPSADRAGFVFGAGELVILAARPGVGKTSLATQIGMHHASKGRAVLMASLEMRDRDLITRVVVSSAGHNHQQLRTGRIYQECVDDLRRSVDGIGRPPLFVWSPGRVKAGMIHAATSAIKASNDVRLLIVDYLSYVRPDDRSQQRYEQVGEICKALRDIGQNLQIPVLCLAQLGREADNSEPKLSNLRESGDIEQDADIVAFLHRPDPKDIAAVDLIVAKDRQGAVGRAELIWHPEHTYFEDTSGGSTWEP